MATMTSKRPYLIRACYDWIVDNQLTPYILVNANYPDIEIPQEHVNSGRILLNISPSACRGLHLENDRILFTARFGGVATQIFIYPAAILAIYAKENGEGMEFPEEDEVPPPRPSGAKDKNPRSKPSLKIVK